MFRPEFQEPLITETDRLAFTVARFKVDKLVFILQTPACDQ